MLMEEYEVRKSKRKTLSIIVEHNCKIIILAPKSMTDEEISKVIKEKEFWIYKQIADFNILNQSKIERELINGEGFLYLGRSYKLHIVDEQDVALKLINGVFQLRKKELKIGKAVFKDFYRTKGLVKITERVEKYSKLMGLNPSSIKVMELQSHWASCGTNNSLNFNWKCVMAPYSVIDYIVVHELAHLIYPNHSEEFWSEVDKVLPEYRKSLEWLRKNGASLNT